MLRSCYPDADAHIGVRLHPVYADAGWSRHADTECHAACVLRLSVERLCGTVVRSFVPNALRAGTEWNLPAVVESLCADAADTF